MSKNQVKNNNKGFTIIEVLIVLAIAALILLVVFLAVPSLQRSQRNNGKQSEASRLSSQINTMVSNNQGFLPGYDLGAGKYLTAQATTDAAAFWSGFGTWKYIPITTPGGVGAVLANTATLTANRITLYSQNNVATITPVASITVNAFTTANSGAIGVFDGEKCGTSGATTMTLTGGTGTTSIALVYTTETATNNVYNYSCIQVQ